MAVQHGSGYCAVHAPQIESASSADMQEQGRYTGYAGGLEAQYQSALQDRYLLHLRDEIAILDARVKDLLTQAKTGVNAATWKKVSEQWRQFRRAMAADDVKAINALIATIEQSFEEGRRDADLWVDIQSLMEQRRRLVETEQKYLHNTNQMITAEAALVLLSGMITAMKASVRKYVPNSEVTEAIVVDAQREYERLIGA